MSGAISFRDTEQPSDEQVKKIMETFRASFLPGLKDCENYADAWIAHRDKGNLELHFVVAGTEFQTGRQLNIHPPGPRNIQHFQTFTQVINQAMGYDQVMPDPLKVTLSAFEAKSQAGKKSRRVKTLLAKELHSHIVSGSIANRDDLIAHLDDNYGEVTRVGKDYISIRLPGSSKAKRLRGPLFQEGADYPQLVAQHRKALQPQRLTAEEYAQAKTTLEKLTSERAAYFAKRYKKKTAFKRSIRRRGKGLPGITPNSAAQAAIEPAQAALAVNAPVNASSAVVGDAVAGIQASVSAHAEVSVGRASDAVESTTFQASNLPINTGAVMGLEMQLGSLAHLVSKLMVRARTATSTAHYEILHAQIVKLQHQMAQLSLILEAEKARAVSAAEPIDVMGKPKV